MEKSRIRVIVVDDYKPWQDCVCSWIEEAQWVQVVGSASDGLEAVQRASELQPDLILLDIGLPKLNGIEAARQIRQCAPKSRILFLATARGVGQHHLLLQVATARSQPLGCPGTLHVLRVAIAAHC